MHADATQLIGRTCGQSNRTASRVSNCGAIVGFTGVADVVVGDIGTRALHRFTVTAAGGGEKSEAERQNDGQQGANAHGRSRWGLNAVQTEETVKIGSYRGETAFRAGFSQVSTTRRARPPQTHQSIEKLMGEMQL